MYSAAGKAYSPCSPTTRPVGATKHMNTSARKLRPRPVLIVHLRPILSAMPPATAKPRQMQGRRDGQHHGGAGGGVHIINNIVADIGADGVVGHEPQKLRAENGEKHGLVGLGHGLVVVDRGLDGGETLTLGHLVLHLLGDLVLAYREEQHHRGDDHQHGTRR